MKPPSLALIGALVLTRVAAPAGDDGQDAFTEHSIATELRGGYQTVVVDLNQDGGSEIVAGQRAGERSLIMYSASKDGAT